MKRKILFLLLFVVLSNYAFSQFSGGDGTENNPYRITSKKDLEELNDSIRNSLLNNPRTDYNWSRGKYFKIMNDITDSIKFCIGKKDNTYSSNNFICFQGVFDGNNHKITLAINNYWSSIGETKLQSNVGLFSGTYQAKISNLAVDGYIKNNTYTDSNLSNFPFLSGGITGTAIESQIYNCINYADIIVDNSCVGGIVGHLEKLSKITNCTNNGNLKSISDFGGGFGGIVGHSVETAEILNCINIGTIEGLSLMYLGGIVGAATNTTIINCINSGFVSGDTQIGGITGCILGNSTVKNCLNTGVVKGNTKWGCIVGENQGGTIINCHYDKQMCGGGE